MRLAVGLCGLALALNACTSRSEAASVAPSEPRGFNPKIVVGPVDPRDATVLQEWIDGTLTILLSPEFEANLLKIGQSSPDVWISKSSDAISVPDLLDRLHMRDPLLSDLWWPETQVVIKGDTAIRSPDRTGFGFEAVRDAGAGPYPVGPVPTLTGEIELGRLHFARYDRGDVVERSCAVNTMAHEIAHTLSDRPDRFWMHILDTGENAHVPRGMFEASYLIGTVAQCTYLQVEGRLSENTFETCVQTFSDPSFGSRFKSRACDDFPGDTPITPAGRIEP